MDARSPAQMRAEVRRTLAYIRTMRRLRQVFSEDQFNVKVSLFPRFEIIEAPRWEDVGNLLSRFRPIYLDSEKVSFRSMVKVLPYHVRLQPGVETFGDLENRWDDVLNGSTAPIPSGSHILGPGFQSVSEAPGTLQVAFEGQTLTGREAIDLCLYGELVHVDLGKERRLLRINASFVAPGYRLALMSVTAELVRTADLLRAYAEDFIETFRRTLGEVKLREIEDEFG